MAKPIYKILANKPTYESYGQYVYDSSPVVEEFWDKTGLSTPFNDDDLYTIITSEDSFIVGNGVSGLTMPDDSTNFDSIANDTLASYFHTNWRAVSNVFVGNKINEEQGVYLQQYYKFDDMDYFRTSAPNLVHLYFDFYLNENIYDLDGDGYYPELLVDFYKSKGAADTLTSDILMSESPEYIKQRPRLKVINWDWKSTDPEETSSPDMYTAPSDGGFLIDEDGKNIVYSHQYNSPGIKTIKAIVYTNLNNNELNPSGNYYYYQHVTIRLNLGLDGIYIEDFSTLGGPDFTFLPWPYTAPIIGGISTNSDYYISLRKLVKANPFSQDEEFDKFFALKSYFNDETGESLPDMDLQQIRVFKSGGFDMNYILGINTQVAPDAFTFNHYDDDYWNGNDGFKFTRNSPFEIFIDDVEELSLRYNCLLEFPGIGLSNSYLTDTSSNGIKGILIGDYKVKKDTKDTPVMRDSVMKTLKIIEDDDGAI